MADYPVVHTLRDGASFTAGFCCYGLHLQATVSDRDQSVKILDVVLTDDTPSVVQAVTLHNAITAMICEGQTKPVPFCLGKQEQASRLCPLGNGGDTPWVVLIPGNQELNAFRLTEAELRELDRALTPWISND